MLVFLPLHFQKPVCLFAHSFTKHLKGFYGEIRPAKGIVASYYDEQWQMINIESQASLTSAERVGEEREISAAS